MTHEKKTNVIPMMTMTTDSDPFVELSDPDCGHVSDAHIRRVLFYGESPTDVLSQVVTYVYSHELDDYVIDVTLKILDDDDFPYVISLLVEASL